MKLWLPVWITARFLWVLAAMALLLALSPGLPVFTPLAILIGAALLVAALADAILGPRPRDLRVERTPPGHFALAVPATLSYTVENRSRVAVRVAIVETPVQTLRYDVDEIAGEVPAQSRATIVRSVTPVTRGAADLQSLYVWCENALGLLRRRRQIAAPQPIRVYPDLSAVERYGALHVRNRTIEAGLRRIQLRGIGTEFESLREWSDGDAFRTVDWKATARRGKLMVAQHEVERSQSVVLLLDCGLR